MSMSRRSFSAAAGAAVVSGFTPAALGGAAPIPRRPFGRHGIDVPVVGLGGGGRFFELVPDDEAGGELVRQVIDHGIEFIETAANYGPPGDGDRSERRIGLAMKTHRSKVFLETKVDARDYDGAMREIERSLKLFHTDHIDLLLHHAFFTKEQVDRALASDGAERAIRRMVDQKAIRFRGFSCHSPELALATIPRLEPHAIQLPINATKVPDFELDVLPLAESQGIAVMAMKTCGHGFFTKAALAPGFDSRRETDKNPELHRFGPPADVFEKSALPQPNDFLHYALSLPITTAVTGIESVETMKSVLQGVATFKMLSAAEMRSIHQRAQPLASTGYWIPRTGRAA
jgi:aryl-alcohol dehydrogenase-like predicted oxidoreductase